MFWFYNYSINCVLQSQYKYFIGGLTPVVLIKERPTAVKEASSRTIASDEMVMFCPSCKAVQTVWFSNDKMIPTRKFSQYDGLIFHDCGSKIPCRCVHWRFMRTEVNIRYSRTTLSGLPNRFWLLIRSVSYLKRMAIYGSGKMET